MGTIKRGKPKKGSKICVFTRRNDGGADLMFVVSKKYNAISHLNKLSLAAKTDKKAVPALQDAIASFKAMQASNVPMDRLKTTKYKTLSMSFVNVKNAKGLDVLSLRTSPGVDTPQGLMRALSCWGTLSKRLKAMGVAKPNSNAYANNVTQFRNAIKEAGWEIRLRFGGTSDSVFILDDRSDPFASVIEKYKARARSLTAKGDKASEANGAAGEKDATTDALSLALEAAGAALSEASATVDAAPVPAAPTVPAASTSEASVKGETPVAPLALATTGEAS